METMAATLKGVRLCLSSNRGRAEPGRATDSPLHGLDRFLTDIAGVMWQRHELMRCTSGTSEVANRLGAIQNILESMEQKQDSYITTMAAYHHDVAAMLANQQVLLSAFLPYLLAQGNAAGNVPSTSSALDVCVPPLAPGPWKPPSPERTHTTEEEDVDFISVLRKTAQ